VAARSAAQSAGRLAGRVALSPNMVFVLPREIIIHKRNGLTECGSGAVVAAGGRIFSSRFVFTVSLSIASRMRHRRNVVGRPTGFGRG